MHHSLHSSLKEEMHEQGAPQIALAFSALFFLPSFGARVLVYVLIHWMWLQEEMLIEAKF